MENQDFQVEEMLRVYAWCVGCMLTSMWVCALVVAHGGGWRMTLSVLYHSLPWDRVS